MSEAALHIDSELQQSVLFVLEYYDIFNYPLKTDEIHGACSHACSLAEVQLMLDELAGVSKIYAYQQYYALNEDIKEAVNRRLKANELARQKLIKAKRSGAFISGFPFVKFVGISGSLSKGYADDKTDYDFFIVTAENRLWICRTLLHLFKKFTFLARMQHRFCMNYFMDESHKEMEEKNIFTATELSSMIPVSAPGIYIQLINANRWVKNFFPNGYLPFCKQNVTELTTNNFIKNTLEKIINVLKPEKLNEKLMLLTDGKWRKKWKRKNYPMEDYNLAFKTTLHISKNHRLNYQKKVLGHLSKLSKPL